MSGGERTPGGISIPNVVATSHERIFLVIGEGCPPEADFTDCDEVHWCQDKIHENSIGYIREDVALRQRDELLAALRFAYVNGWTAEAIEKTAAAIASAEGGV